MAVHAVYTFDTTEHYHATRAATALTAWRWIPWVVGVIALVLVAATIVQGRYGGDPVAFFLNVLPWLLLSGFWVLMLPLMQRRAARKLPERDASVLGLQERSLDDVGYHSRGNGVALDVPWHVMVKGVETERFFLFFYSKQLAYYIPKRAISDAQHAEVRALLRQHLGERAQLAAE